MKNIAHKLFLAGIGALSLTREKAEQIVNEMVNKGQVKGEEANTVVESLVQRGEEERNFIKQTISKELEKLKGELNLVSRKELEELSARISRLEQQLSRPDRNDRP